MINSCRGAQSWGSSDPVRSSYSEFQDDLHKEDNMESEDEMPSLGANHHKMSSFHAKGINQSDMKMGSQYPPSRAVSTLTMIQPNRVGAAGTQVVVKKEHAIVLRKYKKRRGSNASSLNMLQGGDTDQPWIRENILMRECTRFTPAPPDPKDRKRDEDPKCQCKKRRKKHEERFLQNPDPTAKWKVETHTHTLATNAYGEIEFIGAVGGAVGQKARKFIRVDYDTAPSKLLSLFQDVWKLPKPKLLISVTGGAQNFPLNHRLKDVFRKGLIKAATSTSAWIITGGTHAGVMKYVGDAVRDHTLANGRSNVVAIGIASWGVIRNREKLIDDNGKFPASYNMDAKKGNTMNVPIDPNHTHFILVDNGTIDTFGVEITLRGKLEKAISEEQIQKSSGNDTAVSIPIVCVVVQGGPNTIQTAYEAIRNGTPVVIVAGSGRAADIMSYAFQHTKEYKTTEGKKEIVRNVMSETVKVEVANMIQKEFGEKQLDLHLTRIEACIQHKHLITVYELGASATMDIDGAILHALLKANKGRIQDQLRLALIWNRVDVAKREIFTDDREWGKGQLNESLRYALVNNQVNFIELFLEQGVNLKEYLTIKEMTILYNEIRSNSLLYEQLEKYRGKYSNIKFNLEHVGKVIRDLMFDTYQPLYLRDPGVYVLSEDDIRQDKSKRNEAFDDTSDDESSTDEEDDENETGATPRVDPFSVEEGLASFGNAMMPAMPLATIQEHIEMKFLPEDEPIDIDTGFRVDDMNRNVQTNQFEYPLRELFIYAILQNWHDMAKLFWEEGRESIASALAASKMLKGMADKEDDSDQIDNMIAHAETYEELAIGVLNECYVEDEERSALLLVCELPFWGNSTCLNMAVEALDKNFIAHSGVQNLLTQIWMGKISDETSPFQLWMCTLFPPLIYFLVKFREDEGDEEQAELEKRLSSKKEKLAAKSVDDVFVPEGDPRNKSIEMGVVVQPPSESGDSGMASQTRLLENKNGHAAKPKSEEEKDEDTFSLMNARLDIRDSGKELSWWQRFKFFYDAPMITFRHNVLSYIVFLVLYSYVILGKFEKEIFEYVLIVWVISLFTEEFRQIAQGESSTWKSRLIAWITDYWNLLDLATLTSFAVGEILRFSGFSEAGHVVLSLNLILFCIRLLHIFSISKQLGPKLIMIQRMMVDLIFFIAILAVFLIGYGIASQAILFPDETNISVIMRGILMRSYFQIFGELFLEVIEGSDCTDNATLVDGVDFNPCPQHSWIGIILLAGYMMISNVLLLNLLIAMFSYTFSAIQDNTDTFWKFQRYDLIKEYFNRPPLIPPFIIISHFFYTIRFILRCCCHTCTSWQIPELKQSLTDQEKKTLVLWEGINSDNYTAKQRVLVQQDLNERVKVAGDRVEDMTMKLDQVFDDAETQKGKSGHLGGKAFEDRLTRLEDRMERTNDALDWIISALSRGGNVEGKLAPPKLKEIKSREESLDIAEEERRFEVPVSIEALGIMIHKKSRASPYPGTALRRFPVPDNKVPWETDFPLYTPVIYTHKSVKEGPHWADIDLMSMVKNARPPLLYNQMDEKCKYNRRSHMKAYQIKDGLPLNPKGRTGLSGRGLLGRWGPNHAADPIATRWKRKSDGTILMDEEKPVLEFIAIQRVDNQQWAIPGGMVEPGALVSETLRREFGEEALGALNKTEEEAADIREHVEKLFLNGVEVYKGYVDDPRNTDNAWMETVAMNFHDEDGSAFGSFNLEASDDAQSVRWQRVSSKIPLFASHTAMLRKVAELHNAAF
ncbi:transient receptor potential cation channel subfamily M member-like 2 isoform X2 [Lytechinus variegatus]|uniref:transient receptor potential cation channel subfamily M member-like 2 isoform X2 n=1 Tax=Lytechinus variegatus TaxID=7654 RepID=UPI001BB25D36|nr:transient receptor potential cation channel subfamily M member-like 2 isoform X2 [Lytechinus variegatus]